MVKEIHLLFTAPSVVEDEMDNAVVCCFFLPTEQVWECFMQATPPNDWGNYCLNALCPYSPKNPKENFQMLVWLTWIMHLCYQGELD